MSMRKPTAWRESILWTLGRIGIVFSVVFILLLVSAFPFRLGTLSEIRPALLLMFVYYWTILRPDLLPYFATFLAGLMLDLLSGGPLGLHALSFILVRWVTLKQRKFLMGQAFRVIWAGFAVVTLVSGLLQWLVTSLFYGNVLPLPDALAAAVLTVALFPMVVPLFSLVNKALAEDSKQL